MACPNYRINPNYTPGSNYPQYEYTDIASTAQFDPYAASHPQPKPSQQSFAPTVTPYHHNHDTNQVAGPPAGPQHHFIADLPPRTEIRCIVHDCFSSYQPTAATARRGRTAGPSCCRSPHRKKPYDAIVAEQERALREIVVSQERALRETQQQSSSRCRFNTEINILVVH
jgi:hypothetical protein